MGNRQLKKKVSPSIEPCRGPGRQEHCRTGDATIRRQTAAGQLPKSAADELMTASCEIAPSGDSSRSGVAIS